MVFINTNLSLPVPVSSNLYSATVGFKLLLFSVEFINISSVINAVSPMPIVIGS